MLMVFLYKGVESAPNKKKKVGELVYLHLNLDVRIRKGR